MRHLCAALLLALVGAACESSPDRSAGPPPSRASGSPTATPGPPAHSPDRGLPYEGDWVLASGLSPAGPLPLDDDFPITLTLRGRGANGKSTCNGYGGRFKIDGTTFVPGPMGANQAGCAREDLDVAETRYFSALMMVDEVSADDSTLRLTGPLTELVFERIPPLDLDAVVDRTWVVGDHTLLLSSDRTFRITYGCDALEGTWDAMAGRIYMPEARRTEDCPADGTTRVPIDVSSGDFSVHVDDGRLTIAYGGKSVTYRARSR